MKTKRKVEIELEFYGDGRIVQKAPGHFVGGLPNPRIEGNVTFTVHGQAPDESGILNPVLGEASVEGSFQINIYGNTKGYRELGKYLLALAELDTTEDEGFHEHLDELISADGRTHLHLILRKQEKTLRSSSGS